MYFSQYKSNKKSGSKRNRIKKKNKGLFGGILKFIKLTAVIALIIPVLYLIDKGYGFMSDSLNFSRLDSYLRVHSVRIKGNSFITEDELSPFIQMTEGHNILLVDIKDIANKLKRHAWIKDVSVRKEFPDTILVDISERTPSVYVNNNGDLYLADEEGVILGDKADNLLNLPVVYGVNLPKMSVGNKTRVEELLPAIEVKRDLASIPWIDISTTGIEVEDQGQIVLHLQGYRIRLGKGQYKEKLQHFYEISKNLQDKGIPYKEVDLRFDNQVIIKTIKVI